MRENKESKKFKDFDTPEEILLFINDNERALLKSDFDGQIKMNLKEKLCENCDYKKAEDSKSDSKPKE